MIKIPENQCSGCAACANICPTMAISMQPNKFGFMLPAVDYAKCISCTACIKTCPSLNPLKKNRESKVYAAIPKDTSTLPTVSSGGIATIISKKTIQNGGVVFGCTMESIADIKHVECSSISDIQKLRGSKYIQSRIDYTYRQVRENLKQGIETLFIGTPCQVAGLKSYLKSDYENLTTVDLICHGVPSQQIFKSAIEEGMRKTTYNPTETTVEFRWKESGSQRRGIQFGFRIKDKDNNLIKCIDRIHNPYMSAFFSGYSYRENCHFCQFANTQRIGDITLGDFWGLGHGIHTNIDISKGVSLVMINTQKGKMIFDSIEKNIISESHTIEEAKSFNKNLNHPSERPQDKSDFLTDYAQYGLEKAVSRHISTYNKEKSLSYRLYLLIATNWSKILQITRLKK